MALHLCNSTGRGQTKTFWRSHAGLEVPHSALLFPLVIPEEYQRENNTCETFWSFCTRALPEQTARRARASSSFGTVRIPSSEGQGRSPQVFVSSAGKLVIGGCQWTLVRQPLGVILDGGRLSYQNGWVWLEFNVLVFESCVLWYYGSYLPVRFWMSKRC